jgi:CheY-like chemotaxis protein
LAAGDYACLRVCDDGQGVSAEIVENIFDPFFTTRSQGKGIGLGLSVVYGIVENCKGRIRVDSTPGQGSLFEVLLPLVPGTDDPCERTLPGRDEAGLRGHEHILFVDDEAMLVDLGKGLLQPFGYQVSGSVSAERAYDLFRNCPERYDLVVTDQVMPEMNGDELARKILKIRPDVPIIICTGHSSVLTEESVAEIGVRKLLRKPLASRLLLVSVRQALDSGRDPVEKQLAGDRPDDSGEKGGSYGEEAVAEAFLALPEALRDALGEAVESLNPDRIETAIDGISRRKPELGRVLAAWAYDFRFDLLKDLVDSSHSTAAEKGDTT